MGAHLRVEAMLCIVRLDEIVGELVSEDDPPPDGGVGAPPDEWLAFVRVRRCPPRLLTIPPVRVACRRLRRTTLQALELVWTSQIQERRFDTRSSTT